MTELTGISLGNEDEVCDVILHTYAGAIVDENWEYFKKGILRGEKSWGSYETIDSIKNNLVSGVFQLWSLTVGNNVVLFAITRMELYPTGRKDLVIQYIMGAYYFKGFDAFAHLIERVKDFALAGECTTVKVEARPGFVKTLKTLDFMEERVTLTLPLHNKERMN